MKKVLKILLTISLILYLLACSYLYFNQKSMIYFPDNQIFENCENFADYKKESYNGTRFYLKERSKSLVVFYHGNDGSTCGTSYLKKIFEKTNYSLILVEYAGYSSDKNQPSKDLLLKDAENIVNYLKEKQYESITVYGKSLGSGIASYHASIGKVDKLILITPFSNFVDLSSSKYPIFPISLLLTQNYDNVESLKSYKNKVLIIHGDNDKTIPTIFGKTLYDSLETVQKKFVLLKGFGHNDLINSELYDKEIENFIKE